MSKKEKTKNIILISICAVIIIAILIRNVFGGTTKEPVDDIKITYVEKEGILKSEAYRLFHYLDNSEYLSMIENGEEELTCGEFQSLIYNISKENEIDYNQLIQDLPERLASVKKEDKIYLTEFLVVYERLIEMMNQQITSTSGTPSLEFKELYFVGTEMIQEDESKNRMVDKNGHAYYFYGAKDYSDIFIAMEEEKNVGDREGTNQETSDELEKTSEEKEESNQKEASNEKETEPKNNSTSENSNSSEVEAVEYKSVDQYIDVPLKVLVNNNEIIYIRDILQNSVTLNNVYMLEGKDTVIKVFVGGIEKSYQTVLPLSAAIREKVGDITIEDGLITGVTVKPDIINGKVLVTSKKEIEIEGYGKLPFDDNFKIYKVYDTLSMEQTSSILVGYTITDFVVSNGIVCAALIKENIKAENIRVLISTNNYKSYYHKNVTITSKNDFIVTFGDQKKLYEAGEKLTLKPGDEMLKEGRITINSTREEGKIKVSSIERSYGKPEYRGNIEIAEGKNGLTIINELSLEEYLYSVVPSEMPVSYGLEALKVQAVCARSFAYNQLLANKYSEYGAHVDDSVNSQVYNNVKETEETILAVKDTYGQIINYKDKVLTTYYFSTSCGHTADIEDVWPNGETTTYYQGNLQTENKAEVDLSEEEDFRDFINNENVEIKLKKGTITETVKTYDRNYSLYRWHVTISAEDLGKQINENLKSCYNSNKNLVLTLSNKKINKKLEESAGVVAVNGSVYESLPVSDIGTVQSMKIITRGKSGIIKDLLIKGSKKTILVRYQTNIRKLLAPIYDDLYRLDGSTTSGMTMLPSAFFYIDKKDENGKSSKTDFTLVGGGYGHGVGMSQNGVKTMTSEGKTYEEVLKYYYTGISLGFVYK